MRVSICLMERLLAMLGKLGRGAGKAVLSAVSPAWAMTNAVVRSLFSGRAVCLQAPVISIGNIVAGGVGKTEVTVAIAKHFVKQGKRVVVATRGYGSLWEKQTGVANDYLVASDLKFPDEAIVLLKKAPGSYVAVGADRAAVLQEHWEELRPDVILLDDGFQHFALARELDILVHDFDVRLPILRDFPYFLKKAALRISLSELPMQWRQEGAPWVRARYNLLGAVDSSGKRQRLPERILAFCGIGNPERFEHALAKAGSVVHGYRFFGDHQVYTSDMIRELVAWQRKLGYPLVTTLKDYVKIKQYVESQGGIAGFEPYWVEIELQLVENETFFWNKIDEVVAVGSS